MGFKGIVGITTNGKPEWTGVPIQVYLISGNIINIHVNARENSKTKGLRIYGHSHIHNR